MDNPDIYSSTPLISGLFGSLIAWGLGLVILIAGFIVVSRLLIGKRLERAERDWRARQDSEAETQKPAERDRSPGNKGKT